jgi:uncharacterized protein (TIGR03437 family)
MRRLKQFLVVMTMLGALGYSLSSTKVEAKVFGGPPLGFTGAPGEGTCVGCHYTYGQPNPPNTGGSVQISGVPANYTPGQSYTVTVTVTHPTARRWGFEITPIIGEGGSAGTGTLTLIDTVRTIKREANPAGSPRTYISHYTEDINSPLAEDGTYPGKVGSNSWSFTWTAPTVSSGEITFYAVGNAANNQVSPEDDYIYATSLVTRAPNSAPVFATLANRIVGFGDRISFTVSATDPDGSALTYSASALNNSTFDPATHRFTFIPTAEQAGERQVTFTASDGSLQTTKTVTLMVQAEGSPSLTALDKPGTLPDYLDYARVSGLDLTAIGDFGAGAKLVFNGLELTTQAAISGAPGMVAQIPSAELLDPGAYVVRVRLANGTLTNARTLALVTAITPQAAAMVNSASYGASVAPGQLASLFGSDLIVGAEAGIAQTLPLPRSLRATSVYVDGVAAPLFYAGSGQINLQLPYATASGTASVVVLRDDGIAAQGTAQIANLAPAIFTLNSSGEGQAAALNGDFSPNGDATLGAQFKRVRKGEFIIIYASGTGRGLVNATTGQPIEVKDGVVASADPLIITSPITPTVTIGGQAAMTAFSGLAPGFVGLWQLNIQVPATAPSGAAVELLITYGGQSSNRVKIAIE